MHPVISTAMTYLTTVPALMLGSLIVGVLFSTQIKDFFSGVPAEVRTALNGVETATKAQISAAQSGVLATLPKPPAAPAKPDAPVVHQTVTPPPAPPAAG